LRPQIGRTKVARSERSVKFASVAFRRGGEAVGAGPLASTARRVTKRDAPATKAPARRPGGRSEASVAWRHAARRRQAPTPPTTWLPFGASGAQPFARRDASNRHDDGAVDRAPG